MTGSNKIRTLVVYHGPHCNDGFTSAWIASIGIKARNNYLPPDLYSMGYAPEEDQALLNYLEGTEAYEAIYVVDFSLRLPLLEDICNMYPQTLIIILDHHKSAFDMYVPECERTPDEVRKVYLHSGQVSITLVNELSGAGITWVHFFPRVDMPPLVKHVQDRDLWKFKLPGTQAIHKYLNSIPKTLEDWGDVHAKLCHKTGHKEIIAKGDALLDIHNAEVATIVERSEPCVIKGYGGLMVECAGQYASDVGNQLAAASGTYGLTYYEAADGETLHCSLRSKDDYDVEALAKMFGGGGHLNAAGFAVSLEEMIATGMRRAL